ncbi:MAG TPA: hypothetical protein PLI95_01820 [Polyangiaceae bacterium]|nr:hypothetical protein [Polyangiaceae bacterium]
MIVSPLLACASIEHRLPLEAIGAHLRRRTSRGRSSSALLAAAVVAAGWLIAGCSDDSGADHDWSPTTADAAAGDSATASGDAGVDAPKADGAVAASDAIAESSTESGKEPACKAGFADCDGKPGNGCEAQLQVDPRNCGTCGTSCHNGECAQGECQVVTVRALIYAGYDAGQNCVAQTGAALDEANAKNLVPGLSFAYTTATTVVESKLAGQDVLVMPGGDSGSSYLNNSKIDGAAIQAFVSSGKGYFGTCAGAYAAARHTDGHYDGWGLAPNVTCKAVEYIGDLPVSLTGAGEQLLGDQGTIVLHHYRGAAMNAESGATSLALYADGKTGYEGYSALVTDTYGAGRTILSGPHPELEPSKPEWIARAVAWAAGRLTE